MGGGSISKRTAYSKNAGKGSYNARLEDYDEFGDRKPKVFISFSMRNIAQAQLLRQQALNEGYDVEFLDNSLQQPVKGRSWKGPVGTRIQESDALICMVGKDTHSRPAVSWELKKAYNHDIPVIPVQIHRDQKVTKPTPIKKQGDRMITWDLSKIQYELDTRVNEDE